MLSCRAETSCLSPVFPNIIRNYKDFHELGFDVVGVNMDTDVEQVKQFLSLQELPWTSVTTQQVIDGAVEEPWLLPMPQKCGVDGIPFLVLVGKDGKVVRFFDSKVTPEADELRDAIEAALAK